MTSNMTSRWRLGLLAVVCTCVVMGSGFMACGADDSTTAGSMGVGGGGGATGGTCDLALCPDPPFTGLEKCCTPDGMCGVKSFGMTTCFPPGSSSGSGMGGGKL